MRSISWKYLTMPEIQVSANAKLAVDTSPP